MVETKEPSILKGSFDMTNVMPISNKKAVVLAYFLNTVHHYDNIRREFGR